MGTPAALGLHFLPRLSWIRLISWISLVFIILHQFLLICSLDHMCLQSLWTARSAALKGLLLQVNHWACTGGLPTVVSVEQLNPLEGTELLLPANAVCLLVFVAAELRR